MRLVELNRPISRKSTSDDGHSTLLILMACAKIRGTKAPRASRNVELYVVVSQLLIGFDDLPGRSEKPPKSPLRKIRSTFQ